MGNIRETALGSRNIPEDRTDRIGRIDLNVPKTRKLPTGLKDPK
jgi:hypothetical protein